MFVLAYWMPGSETVFDCVNLERLLVYKYPYEDITPLSRLTKLDSLSFLNTYRLKSVRGVAALQNMEYLGFFLCPKLTDITEVAELKQMKELAFDTCKNARPFDIVGSLKRLRSLDFSNCGAIGSIAALRDTPDLEEFLFSESTNVLDGDLSPMASLPKLRCHAFRDRKHYSHTSDYFDEHAGAGHGRGGPRKRFGTFGDPNYEPLTVRPASS
ncbi:MAG TPA: leucine-rich repeat protein [Pirellulales bacterium]|nr:leucine-rich repeat protein [Pirellulales bacterium]